MNQPQGIIGDIVRRQKEEKMYEARYPKPYSSRWIKYALTVVGAKYPSPKFRIAFEEPTLEVPKYLVKGSHPDREQHIRADLAVYDPEDKLIAVVEVGDLSRPDKLEVLEELLPGTSVWWLPKTDHLAITAWTTMQRS